MSVFSEQIRGRSVIDSTGRVVGELEELVVDPHSWHIEALRVKLHRGVTDELSVSHGAFRAGRLNVPTEFVQDVTDTIVLRGPIGTVQTQEAQPRGEAP